MRVMPRRNGDIPFVVSKAAKISDKIGWAPKHDDIAEIIRSSVAWQKCLMEKRGERKDTKRNSVG
jgi:UDP-glucose 4-epimerase